MKVFGLFGEKLSHSLSPVIHNHFYHLLNIEATYSLYQIRPELLADAMKGIKALSLQGVNVTIPYKVKVMEYLDRISPEACRIGAVNTIFNSGDRLSGYNTDYIGFGKLLQRNDIDPTGKNAVVLGSGGAAKSVVAYLEDHNISNITIVSRNILQASTTVKHEVIDYDHLTSITKHDLLINCTPIGMHPNVHQSPLPQETIIKFNAVVDLIYNPATTQLMQQAKNTGIRSCNGLYMLVAQAAAAVEIWNGIKIQEELIDDVYNMLIENHIK